ncbi:MAG: hypothetical protein HY925_04260 [Elusimicrobia bacterium]|nr:hypothetical protein [Elusimicrobiota bacterium]
MIQSIALAALLGVVFAPAASAELDDDENQKIEYVCDADCMAEVAQGVEEYERMVQEELESRERAAQEDLERREALNAEERQRRLEAAASRGGESNSPSAQWGRLFDDVRQWVATGVVDAAFAAGDAIRRLDASRRKCLSASTPEEVAESRAEAEAIQESFPKLADELTPRLDDAGKSELANAYAGLNGACGAR